MKLQDYNRYNEAYGRLYGDILPDYRAGRISKPDFLSAMASVDLHVVKTSDFLTNELERFREEVQSYITLQQDQSVMERLEQLADVTERNGLNPGYALLLIPREEIISIPVISNDGLKMVPQQTYRLEASIFDDLPEQGMNWSKGRILGFVDELQAI